MWRVLLLFWRWRRWRKEVDDDDDDEDEDDAGSADGILAGFVCLFVVCRRVGICWWFDVCDGVLVVVGWSRMLRPRAANGDGLFTLSRRPQEQNSGAVSPAQSDRVMPIQFV